MTELATATARETATRLRDPAVTADDRVNWPQLRADDCELAATPGRRLRA